MPTTTGPDLRAERKRINTKRAARGLPDVTVSAVARAMGVPRQLVHSIEGAAFPKPEHIQAYLDAVRGLDAGTVTA